LHEAPDQVVALARARWLDELTDAIALARRLAWRLGVAEGDSEQARELYARLEALQSEVASLRGGNWVAVRKEIDPVWLENLLEGSPRVFDGPGDRLKPPGVTPRRPRNPEGTARSGAPPTPRSPKTRG